MCGYTYSGGTVINCKNTGSVRGTNILGGVCGANSSNITNCFNKGTVSGQYEVGGVCGFNGGKNNKLL